MAALSATTAATARATCGSRSARTRMISRMPICLKYGGSGSPGPPCGTTNFGIWIEVLHDRRGRLAHGDLNPKGDIGESTQDIELEPSALDLVIALDRVQRG